MKFRKAILNETVGGPNLLKKKLTEYLVDYLKNLLGNYDAFDAMGDIVDIFQDTFGALVSPKQKEAILGTLEMLEKSGPGKYSPGLVKKYYESIWNAYKTGEAGIK